jgi:Circadian oscillating protein COP23
MLSRLSIGTLMTLTLIVGLSDVVRGEGQHHALQTISPHGQNSVKPFVVVGQAQKSDIKFICAPGYDRQTKKRLPTTYAWTPRGKIAIVRWETTAFKGYTPEERCQQVSPKFGEAYRNGSLKFLTNGKQGTQPVICTTRQYNGSCVTTLMTLRSMDNPSQVLEGLVATLNGRGVGPVRHSSGVPQRFYEVNVANFLETAQPE